jgi:hypothetical protein
VVTFVDSFQRREREAARDRRRGDVLRVMDIALDLLRIRTNQGHEEVHRVKLKGIGERGRTRAHCRWQIRADKLAVLWRFRRAIRRLEEIFAREKKRDKGGGL